MKRTNKKAMELSINFIVLLIIALVVFGMGLFLFKKFFVEAENIKQNLDEQTRKELQAKMMSSSEEVVVYPAQFTVQKGHGDVIGVGILNIANTIQQFTITSNYEKCYDREGIIGSCGVNPIGVMATITRTVASNKREIFDVPFKVKSDAASAKYSVKITVSKGVTQLSSNLVYIDVP